MDCTFETTAAGVQDLDDRIARHAREVHKTPSPYKEMWDKIHTAEKPPLLPFFHKTDGSSIQKDFYLSGRDT